jgi:hypothetical protein
MASFIKKLESIGVGAVERLAGDVAPAAAAKVATSFGGPLAGAVARALVNSVVTAEKNHLNVSARTGESLLPSGIASDGAPLTLTPIDTRKLAVLQDFDAFYPVIEALAVALGHPIADPDRFKAALPSAVDATVIGIDAYAEMIAALHVPPPAPEAPAAAQEAKVAA